MTSAFPAKVIWKATYAQQPLSDNMLLYQFKKFEACDNLQYLLASYTLFFIAL